MLRTTYVIGLLIIAGALLALANQVRSSTPASNPEVVAAAELRNLSGKLVAGGTNSFLPINRGRSVGRLIKLDTGTQAQPTDIVLSESAGIELPRVAGIITTFHQSPLQKTNLKALLDDTPNAFIRNATSDPRILSLVNQLVELRVTSSGYEIRSATQEQLDAYIESNRVSEQQAPPRDLAASSILPLDQISFADSHRFGVKAANLAAMRRFDLEPEVVPDGYAMPFRFYDDFMTYNGLYDYARQLMFNPQFRSDGSVRKAELSKLRSLIKKGKLPPSMTREIDALHSQFPFGSSIRCRSSTNNEAIAGFHGAGLYDSYTHHPDEGNLSKSVKQVFSSLWNEAAFDAREQHGIDHFQSAMAVIFHPNFKGERVDGAAITSDIIFSSPSKYYVSSQVADAPESELESVSNPEELLLDWWDPNNDRRLRDSSFVSPTRALLSRQVTEQLRDDLGVIHREFAKLYGTSPGDEEFAMEVEFKVTRDKRLVIKQARPWVIRRDSDIE